MTQEKCLVVGGGGALGQAIVKEFLANNFEVWISSRTPSVDTDRKIQLLGIHSKDQELTKEAPVFDAVVWSQGMNINDSIGDFSEEKFDDVFQANVGFVLSTMSTLLSSKKISHGSRLCIISSIWQEAMRPNKLSYSVAKSAISGLVRSAAVDLAEQRILVNAILPGVLDTPMTRSVLSEEQIRTVANRTGFGRLVTPEEVAIMCHFVCSKLNTTLSGQSLISDLGFSNVRPI
jgi:hypothetical protein